jgi:DNA primase
MFGNVTGLDPGEAARWTAMVERCRPLLAAEGMEAVQVMLAGHGMSVIQAIAITRALLGWDETPLRVAIDTVATSEVRATRSPDSASLQFDAEYVDGIKLDCLSAGWSPPDAAWFTVDLDGPSAK